MNISLRRGEKVYINGAVLRVDRKVCIELLNDVTFLLENYVMQADDADTVLKQLYFVIQMALMSPNDEKTSMDLYRSMMTAIPMTVTDARILDALETIERLVKSQRYFDALKTLKGVFPVEAEILALGSESPSLQHANSERDSHAA